ncbi:MAG: hypothetical protein AD742_01115 [Methylibium sp. NZG]|nr:MAG: hypothetical protein AD742_01115 [Methylibium sp. NZG]
MSAALAGCTGPFPATPGSPLASDIQTSAGSALTREQVVAAMRRADLVLLGEVHDNPHHHRERAALLKALADRRPTVVFEQFPRAANAALASPVADDLDAWLDRTGFDRKGWAWPLHRPLVDAALAAGLPLRGGNLARDEARQIARQGANAAPPDLAAALAQPLPAAAASALDQALIDGHCGQLPTAAVPRMRDAQAARDAAMADALLRALADGASSAVLIAGNGHVRRDHGVPLWLARRAPKAAVLSVGFLERDADGGAPPAADMGAYDIVWFTPRQPRADPCAGFTMPLRSAPAAR